MLNVSCVINVDLLTVTEYINTNVLVMNGNFDCQQTEHTRLLGRLKSHHINTLLVITLD